MSMSETEMLYWFLIALVVASLLFNMLNKALLDNVDIAVTVLLAAFGMSFVLVEMIFDNVPVNMKLFIIVITSILLCVNVVKFIVPVLVDKKNTPE
jgi:hypothetical protein